MLSGLFYKRGSFLIMKETGQAGYAGMEILSTGFISAESFHLQRTRECFVPTPGNETHARVLLSQSLSLVSMNLTGSKGAGHGPGRGTAACTLRAERPNKGEE